MNDVPVEARQVKHCVTVGEMVASPRGPKICLHMRRMDLDVDVDGYLFFLFSSCVLV